MPGLGITFVATNVPGVQVPQYIAGRQVVDSVGLMPLGGNLGYGVAIGTYNQKLYVGMMSEPRVMPDLPKMKEHVAAAYSELRDAALQAKRRRRKELTAPRRRSQRLRPVRAGCAP